MVFGPPPSDIAILQDRRPGPARAAPGNTLSIETLLPTRRVRQSPAPDPASLDPASQVAIVTFGQGSSKLSGTARRIIREVVEMQRQQGGRLHVIGHASSWTRDMNPVHHNMINFGLSLDRANTVAQELLRLGLTTNEFSIGRFMKEHPEHRGGVTDLLIGRIFTEGAGEIFGDMDASIERAKMEAIGRKQAN